MAENRWPRVLHVREPGGEPEHSSPGKQSKRGSWEYQDYWPESLVREELETAWLRGWTAHEHWGSAWSRDEVQQMAADYASRVVGGFTRPARPEPEGEERRYEEGGR